MIRRKRIKTKDREGVAEIREREERVEVLEDLVRKAEEN